jgi:hypothetical protein
MLGEELLGAQPIVISQRGQYIFATDLIPRDQFVHLSFVSVCLLRIAGGYCLAPGLCLSIDGRRTRLRLRDVLAQPQHVCERRDVVVPSGRKMRERGYDRVRRGGDAERAADHQRQRRSERVVVQAAAVSGARRELCRLTGPVPQLVRQECSRDHGRVVVGVGGSAELRNVQCGPPHHVPVRGNVVGWRGRVECLGGRARLREEE